MRGFSARGFGRVTQPMEEPSLANLSWVAFSGSAVIAGQENVSSVTDGGAGDFTVTWTRPFATASSYACVMTSSISNPFLAAFGHFDSFFALDAASVRTAFYNYVGPTASDPLVIYLVAIGEF